MKPPRDRVFGKADVIKIRWNRSNVDWLIETTGAEPLGLRESLRLRHLFEE